MSEEKIIYKFSEDPTGTHALLLNEVASNSDVLDIGTAGGYLGDRLIKNKNCKVWGVEPNDASCRVAKEKGYQDIFCGSVEKFLAGDKFNSKQYDYLLAGDVFEHLVDPEAILKALKILLKPDGKLILSVPNVAHYSIRFGLLFGNWQLADSGILDRTHLHFYNLKGIKDLLLSSGWKIEKVRPRGDIERWARKLGFDFFGQKLLFWFFGLLAVQYIIVAKLD